MSYFRVKLAEKDDPSELTNSVEWREWECQAPISKVGPPSPSTSQQRWSFLFFISLTEVGVKARVRGFSLRQDRVDKAEAPPPQIILPHWLWLYLTSPGRSGRLQEWLVWGLNTSTLTPTEVLGSPPVIITPGTKYYSMFVIYKVYKVLRLVWKHLEEPVLKFYWGFSVVKK